MVDSVAGRTTRSSGSNDVGVLAISVRSFDIGRPRWVRFGTMSGRVVIEPMRDADWPEVRRIYEEGIATGNATLERAAPDWSHFDHSHRHDCRFVARQARDGPVLGWTALSAYSARRVYAGVAWESVYVAADARGQGIGRALLQALIPASEAAGLWTLVAGVQAENAASLGLHESVGFRRVGVFSGLGKDSTGRWRDVVILERRSTLVGVD